MLFSLQTDQFAKCWAANPIAGRWVPGLHQPSNSEPLCTDPAGWHLTSRPFLNNPDRPDDPTCHFRPLAPECRCYYKWIPWMAKHGIKQNCRVDAIPRPVKQDGEVQNLSASPPKWYPPPQFQIVHNDGSVSNNTYIFYCSPEGKVMAMRTSEVFDQDQNTPTGPTTTEDMFGQFDSQVGAQPQPIPSPAPGISPSFL